MTSANDGRPVIYTPDNEPYLGRTLLMQFDDVIVAALETSSCVAAWTREHGEQASDLQRAAMELVPHGISIALAVRELIRQAYLFPAAVLLRPLVERATTISYLQEHGEALTLWARGWPYQSRPSLAKMAGDVSPRAAEAIRLLNHIEHGDPIGAQFNMGAAAPVFVVGKVLDHPELCDLVASVALCELVVLQSAARVCFGVGSA